MKNKTIKVDYLARVEGEGSIYAKVKNGEVVDVKFKIFEPPRFFEAFLRGRKFSEVPDITARICGICPVAYQMSSVNAIENAFGFEPDAGIRELRRLIYCGEWIESHVLHVFMLHAPDFLGYQDAIEMAKDHRELVETALRMKKIGNKIMSVVGGREIHPVNVKAGGFYRLPSKKELSSMLDDLKWGRDRAIEAVRFTAGLDFPEFESDYEFIALRHPAEYPFNEGRLVSNKGLDIKVNEYDIYFRELHVRHSNALHSILKERGSYFVGPLARFNLNFDRLSPLAKQAADDINLKPEVRNPYKSIIVRAIETLYAFDEAIRIIEGYTPPDRASAELIPVEGTGYGCTEAPRGLLYHRYKIGSDGLIKDAKIVPPTSQNQLTIEKDLSDFINANLDLPDRELRWKCEQAVRNYDPCISCATHFLKLKIDGR